MVTQAKGMGGAALAALLVLAAAFADAAEVVLRLPDRMDANVGDVVEVGVDLEYGETAPATVVFFVAYEKVRLAPEKEYFEVVRRDANGDPVLDDEGAVDAYLTGVLPSAEVTAAGKSVEAEHLADLDDGSGRAATGVVVTGLNDTVLPEGRILTLAFRVLEANFLNDTIALDALDAAAPALHGSRILQSSAATAAGGALETDAVGGVVALGCVKSAAPEGLQASTDQTDGVKVSWTGVPGMEYRVLRSDPETPEKVTALGGGWSEAALFLDITAPAPEVVKRPVLFCRGKFTPETRLYQVKARPVGGGCESGVSAAAEGYRSAKRSVAVDAAKTLFATFFGGWFRPAAGE